MWEIHTQMLELVWGGLVSWSVQVVCLGCKRERLSSSDLKCELMRQKPVGCRLNSMSGPISPSEQIIKALRPSGELRRHMSVENQVGFPKSG